MLDNGGILGAASSILDKFGSAADRILFGVQKTTVATADSTVSQVTKQPTSRGLMALAMVAVVMYFIVREFRR